MVASRAPQYLQSGSSVDVAAPHIGQLSVSAFIKRILAVEVKLDYETLLVRFFRRNSIVVPIRSLINNSMSQDTSRVQNSDYLR